ncbi:AtpZ/AtpI family protein [Mesorhizobium sp. SP-1A]|uniref:AtpZ/AtpI family protein n=1 Tax=Mesorhizobium sp. SP-1A TaxID=3077840 RepID=UPI0028F74B0F|nr:AtpZ/AtpI family protein [Mesorhizobium sp. SP-1A]
MADEHGPAGTGGKDPARQHDAGVRDEELERRRRELGASLATRLPDRLEGEGAAKAERPVGYAQAFKLSSEFIAGIAVGVAIGWIVDRMAGTSPWGLIVFLLLGFGAGILNVLRSAGLVAEFGQGRKPRSDPDK